MKKPILCLGAALILLAGNDAAYSTTIVWTNTAGGNWNDASGWNPNLVPGDSDNALITNAGAYLVTLDVSPVIAALTLGGSSGQQTLAMGANSLTLTNASFVKTNGVLQLQGGLLGGAGPLAVNGTINWTGGRIDTNTVLTVASNGLIFVDAGFSEGALDFSGVLTNAGTIVLTNGGIRCIAFSGYNGGYGLLVNAPGGLIDLRTGSIIAYYNDNSGIGLPSVANQGTILKSSGSDTTQIDAPFFNSGTLDVQSGIVNLNGGGSGSGIYQAEPGATLAYPADYEVDGTIAGAGTNLLDGGLLTFDGSVTGQFVWISGRINPNSVGNVAANGLMLVNPGSTGTTVDFQGILTNAGVIVLTNGGIRCIDFSGYGGGYGLLVNAPGGLIDLQAGSIIDYYNDNSGIGVPTVINNGTVHKSSASDTTPINPPFFNSGALDVQSGTVSVNGGGSGHGTFLARAGSTLVFGNDYEVDSSLTGAGTNLFTAGSFILNGSLNTSNAVLTGSAVLAGATGVIASQLTWNASGRIGANAMLTVAANALLYVDAGVASGAVDLSGVLTNAGTIVLTNGGIRCIEFGGEGGGTGLLVNAPGGLIDLRDGSIISFYNDNSGVGVPSVVNRGIVRKSSGSDTCQIDPPFYNSGLLDAQTGVISLDGIYDLTGGTLNFALNSLTDFGQIALSGAAVLTGAMSANLNNGYVPATGSSFPVLTYGSETGAFANTSLPSPDAWQTNYDSTTFTLTVLNVRPTLLPITGGTVNELNLFTTTASATDPDAGQSLTFGLVSPPSGMSNNPTTGAITWTPSQLQSPSTNTITAIVTDNGTPPLTGTNTFTVIVREVNVAPSLPTILTQTVNESALLTVINTATNFNIHSTNSGYKLVNPPSNMVISASGIITWTPAPNQSPSTNTITTVVTNSNPYDLVNPHLTATNSFTVIVYAPTLAALGNFTVNAGQTITFTASATDNDPTRVLTFSLVAPPTGATVGSANGHFNWRPGVAFANSTNAVQVKVTDNSAPSVSDSKSFTVTVNPLAPVILTPVSYASGQFKLSVSGAIGPDYIIITTGRLTNWIDLATNLSPTTPFLYTDTNAPASNRFYGVRLSP